MNTASMDPQAGTHHAVFSSFRPSFLVLAPVCVLLGVATALQAGSDIQPWHVLAVLVVALAAHIAVNTLNEYQDFRSGLDLQTRRTPFSGGSGALPARPDAAGKVLAASLTALAIAVAVGLYLAWLRGPSLLLIGLAGVALILSYTRWLNRHPWLCLVAPGLGFGPVMVVGTHVVLTGQYDWPPLLASLVSFFLVNNLLLLNQYPDMAADRAAGRNTFPLVYGIGRSNLMYGLSLLLAAASIVVAIALGQLPPLSAAALLPLLLGLAALLGAIRHRDDIEALMPALGMNVATAILTPLLLGIAILAG